MIISLMSRESFDYLFLTYIHHFCRTNGHNISMLQNLREATMPKLWPSLTGAIERSCFLANGRVNM